MGNSGELARCLGGAMLTTGAVQGWENRESRCIEKGRAEVGRCGHEGRIRLHSKWCKQEVKAGGPPRAPFTVVNVNVDVELKV